MKFKNMNRIFGNAKMPMNLQFFADGEGGETPETADGEDAGGETPETKDNNPTYEQLVAQLAQERADKEKYKNLNDKSSREAAEYKKQLRTKLTAEEQEDIAKKEADEAKDARIKELEEKMAIIDNTSFWVGKSIGMDETLAKATAEAEAKGDKEAFRKNIEKHIKSIRDSAYQQALKDRPDIAAGHGTADKKSLAAELAVKSAKKNTTADTAILKNYIVGGF